MAWKKKQNGQALVEFAIVFPLFIGVLVFITFTLLTLYDVFTLHEAVKEAARFRAASSTAELSDKRLRQTLDETFALTGFYAFSPLDAQDLKIRTNVKKTASPNVTLVEATGKARSTIAGGLLGITGFPPPEISYTLYMNQEWGSSSGSGGNEDNDNQGNDNQGNNGNGNNGNHNGNQNGNGNNGNNGNANQGNNGNGNNGSHNGNQNGNGNNGNNENANQGNNGSLPA